MTKLEKLQARADAMRDIGPDDTRWLLERLEGLETENKQIRCMLEAAINTAETYSKQLATAATVAENIGRLWGHVLPKSARVALANMGKS